jgi:hypothetical protein
MRRTQLITTAALVAACAAPATAAAQSQDLRSPDARDAATASETNGYTDLRSPDARDATTGSTAQYSDLRSPDARDAGRPPVDIPTPVVQVRDVPAAGFDWGDAGIGAAGMLALSGIAAALALLVGARRRDRGFQVQPH